MSCKMTMEVEYFWFRCPDCGRWWAREAREGTCPVCAAIKVAAADKRAAAAERIMRSLRGVIARMRKQKARCT